MNREEAEKIAIAVASAEGEMITHTYVLEALSAAGLGWQFVYCDVEDPDCLNAPKLEADDKPSYWMNRIPVAVRPSEEQLPF